MSPSGVDARRGGVSRSWLGARRCRAARWRRAQRALPGSGLRKALEYMLERWRGLTVLLDNAWVPLDNNLVERQLRDMVLITTAPSRCVAPR
jgi:hypothetical protein